MGKVIWRHREVRIGLFREGGREKCTRTQSREHNRLRERVCPKRDKGRSRMWTGGNGSCVPCCPPLWLPLT